MAKNLTGKWTRQRAIPRPVEPLRVEDITRCCDTLERCAERMRAVAELTVSDDRSERVGALASLLMLGNAAGQALIELSKHTEGSVQEWQ